MIKLFKSRGMIKFISGYLGERRGWNEDEQVDTVGKVLVIEFMGISLYIYVCIYITYNSYSIVHIKYILKIIVESPPPPKKYVSHSWRERKKPEPCYTWFLERFYTFYQLIPEQPCKVWSLC